MSQENIDEYDCDKIAVPLSIANKVARPSLGHIFVNEILPPILVFASLLTSIGAGIYFAISLFNMLHDIDNVPIVQVSSTEEYMILTVQSYIINDYNQATIFPDKFRKKHFALTPTTCMQLKTIICGKSYKFKYTKSYKGYYLLQSIEEKLHKCN